MSFSKRIFDGAKQLTANIKSYIDAQIATRAPSSHTHQASQILNFNGCNLLAFTQASSTTINLTQTQRILVIASATRSYGDSNRTVRLYVDGTQHHAGTVGDYVASGGKGGGANECTLACLVTLGAGAHTVSINNFSTGFIIVMTA